MALTSVPVRTYHVFVASPGDVNDERQAVRQYFDAYNRSFAEPRGFRFEVVDWENYSVTGAGRPQELITRQILERYRSSLALVVGIMAQRFGSPSGTHESGTEEEFEWALASVRSGFPELKWFFRDVPELKLDPRNPAKGLAQWERVEAFRARVEAEKMVFSRSYPTSEQFRGVLEQDLGRWLNAAERPWFIAEGAAVPASVEWPPETLAALARRLNDDFVQHMSAGEDIPISDARARYIQSIVRRRPMSRPIQGEENAPSTGEGPLPDFITSDGAQLLVVGAGGTGKTTLLKQMAASGAQRAVEDPASPVFVYLRLTSFDRGEGAFDALLNLLSLAAHTDHAEFEKRWRSGSRPMTLLLDGVNEVAAAYRSACTQALWTLLQNSSARHRYVITSRPGGELESMAANSVDHHQLRVADILAFSPAQVVEYLKAQGRSELQARLFGQLEGLASNPFLLWAIVRTSGDSPHIRNRGTLFHALIGDYVFEKRERNKPPPRPTTYNYRLVKAPVLAHLALTMIEQGITDIADGPVLYQQVGAQLMALELANRRALALQPETFMPENYSGEGLVREVIDNGVLVREGDRLRFMHESVQEYFAAVACRDASAEDLAERVRPLNLGQLQSRGPTFEMLVAWAGLATPDAVTRLVERLRQKHPLLAAHVAREAALGEAHLEPLRQHFISLAGSLHEARRRLAVLGLTTIPSDDAAVARSLLGMLEEYGVGDNAFAALKATATSGTLAMVIASWLPTDKELDDKRVDLLRQVATETPRVVAEALLDQWRDAEPMRPRLTLLAKHLDQRRRPYEPSTRVRETLTTMALEAELGGDASRSALLDEFRVAIEAAAAPPAVDRVGNLLSSQRALTLIGELLARLDEKKQLEASFASMSDRELETIVNHGDEAHRSVALQTLVNRGAPAAVGPVVSASLADQGSRWILDLPALPRALVQSRLDELIPTLDGEILRRAQELAELVSDAPRVTMLAGILDEGSVPLRAAAAGAAGRGGTAGVELLLAQLARESDSKVIDAILKALGASHHPLAAARLLDLLFDHGAREHWPHHSNEPVPFSTGSWPASIHAALADIGGETAALDRVEELIRKPNPGQNEEAIHEARRWLPSPRAASILKEAATFTDARSRYLATWSLASIGDAEAWRTLLEMELALQGESSHVGDAANRMQSLTLDSVASSRLMAVSQAVLRPALAAPDETLRLAAIKLTAALPTTWIDAAWLAEAKAVARQLIRSSNDQHRALALPSLRRLDDDWAAIALDLLDGDPDSTVRHEASRLLGERANEHLLTRLRHLLASGEAAGARTLALRIKALLSAETLRAARDLAAQQLESEDQALRIASILVVAALYNSYDRDDEAWQTLSRRVRDAFDRGGLEETWRAISPHLANAESDEREFVRLVVESSDETASEVRRLAFLVHQLWPDDYRMAARCVLLAIQDDGPRAEQTLRDFEARYAGTINPSWLGDRYEQIGLWEDALRHYRIAIEQNSTDVLPHFKIGWARFVDGDVAGSIESTRRALQLDPTFTAAEFNLGLALLFQHDVAGADAAYRRGSALAKRQPAASALVAFDAAIGDFDQFAPPGEGEAAARIRAWLVAERERLTG